MSERRFYQRLSIPRKWVAFAACRFLGHQWTDHADRGYPMREGWEQCRFCSSFRLMGGPAQRYILMGPFVRSEPCA